MPFETLEDLKSKYEEILKNDHLASFRELGQLIDKLTLEVAISEGPDVEVPSWIWNRFQRLSANTPDLESSLEVAVSSLLNSLAPSRAGFSVVPQFRRRVEVSELPLMANDWSMRANFGDGDDSTDDFSAFFNTSTDDSFDSVEFPFNADFLTMSTPSRKRDNRAATTSTPASEELPAGYRPDSVGNIVHIKGTEGSNAFEIPDHAILKISTDPHKRDEVLVVEESKVQDVDPRVQALEYTDNFRSHLDRIALTFWVKKGQGVVVAIAERKFDIISRKWIHTWTPSSETGEIWRPYDDPEYLSMLRQTFRKHWRPDEATWGL